MRKFWLMLPIAVLMACDDKDDTAGEEADADTDTDTDTDADTDTDTDADTDADTDICTDLGWAQAKADGRASEFMAACVVPPMEKRFQEYDPKAYAEFGCATCHGEDFNEGTYEMPGIFSLDWDYYDYWVKGGIYVGDGSGFMEEVANDMAGILGYDPYDYKTEKGFGCYGCHNY